MSQQASLFNVLPITDNTQSQQSAKPKTGNKSKSLKPRDQQTSFLPVLSNTQKEQMRDERKLAEFDRLLKVYGEEFVNGLNLPDDGTPNMLPFTEDEIEQLQYYLLITTLKHLNDTRSNPDLWEDYYEWIAYPLDSIRSEYSPFSFNQCSIAAGFRPDELQESCLWELNRIRKGKSVILPVTNETVLEDEIDKEADDMSCSSDSSLIPVLFEEHDIGLSSLLSEIHTQKQYDDADFADFMQSNNAYF